MEWNRESDRSAALWGRRGRDCSLMRGDDRSRDRQPEPYPSRSSVTGSTGAIEAIENTIEVGRFNTWSRVGNADHRMTRDLADIDRYRAAGSGITGGIVQNDQRCLLESIPVTLNDYRFGSRKGNPAIRIDRYELLSSHPESWSPDQATGIALANQR